MGQRYLEVSRPVIGNFEVVDYVVDAVGAAYGGGVVAERYRPYDSAEYRVPAQRNPRSTMGSLAIAALGLVDSRLAGRSLPGALLDTVDVRDLRQAIVHGVPELGQPGMVQLDGAACWVRASPDGNPCLTIGLNVNDGRSAADAAWRVTNGPLDHLGREALTDATYPPRGYGVNVARLRSGLEDSVLAGIANIAHTVLNQARLSGIIGNLAEQTERAARLAAEQIVRAYVPDAKVAASNTDGDDLLMRMAQGLMYGLELSDELSGRIAGMLLRAAKPQWSDDERGYIKDRIPDIMIGLVHAQFLQRSRSGPQPSDEAKRVRHALDALWLLCNAQQYPPGTADRKYKDSLAQAEAAMRLERSPWRVHPFLSLGLVEVSIRDSTAALATAAASHTEGYGITK